MSPYLSDYPRYAWQLLTGARSSVESRLTAMRAADVAPYLDLQQPLQILDLANGRLRPQYAILRSKGHNVYGIDLVNRPRKTRVDLAYTVARRLYTWRLGVPSTAAKHDRLICGNVGVLPFPDDSFDLVTSVAAFEHFLDVPSVVSELYRVLRPGGIVWTCIHLFTSPSGGHNLSFAQMPLRSIPQDVNPWDHLRTRRLPFTVPLNEWRRDQYLEAFGRHFEVLKHYCAIREGEALLTPEIRAELAEYSEDELTCAAYIIAARKEA